MSMLPPEGKLKDPSAAWERVQNRTIYLAVKRLQDIVFSLSALVLLSPLFLLIALLVVMDDPHGGPVFSQERVGKDGRLFRMYKFRSMCVDAEAQLKELMRFNEMNGPAFKIKNDPRITRVGAILRKTSLDELPQLVNVLKGDMSLVGPRPPLPREVAQYTQYERQRLAVRPGLTCYWQVHPDRYALSMQEWVELDLRYIRERSWLLDWVLVFRAAAAVVRGTRV